MSDRERELEQELEGMRSEVSQTLEDAVSKHEDYLQVATDSIVELERFIQEADEMLNAVDDQNTAEAKALAAHAKEAAKALTRRRDLATRLRRRLSQQRRLLHGCSTPELFDELRPEADRVTAEWGTEAQ